MGPGSAHIRALLVYYPNMKKFLLLLLFPLTTLAASSDNKWGKFDFDFDEDRPWAELQAQIPAYPKKENYIPFFVSAATDHKFFIDEKSISIGDDGVVRYTLIVKSSGGALNVTFEGMRCATAETKLYAFGRSDGTWSKSRSSKWGDIEYKDRNRQHHVLYSDFFCPGGLTVKSPEVAVRALKSEPNPR